ncbi:MAG: permease [Alphaproteobacteria bacterium]|nr:permease [Alphaproteobacteria bacterium]
MFSKVATDKVVITLIAAVILLGLYDISQMTRSIYFTLDSALYIAPFFALAIAFAGYAKASGLDGLIAKAFSGNLVLSVIAAALVGALSPFCSCGVIPLIAALLAAGVPLPAVMAFWIASPIMDPEMFILTAAGIGFEFAVAKTMAAVALGLFAGFATLGAERVGFLQNPLIGAASCGSSCSKDEDPGVSWAFWQDPGRLQTFLAEVKSTGLFLGKWLALAFFLESLMVAYVPSDWIAAAVGPGNLFAIPLAALIGMPSYLNGYAAIPLVAGLMKLGMTPAAGLAFMTAGAVSSVPAAIAVYALVRKPVFMLYILLGVTGSVITGYIYLLAGTTS